jgi:hypothetical protein
METIESAVPAGFRGEASGQKRRVHAHARAL